MKTRIALIFTYTALLLAAAASLLSCNAQKKNTAAARKYTGFITKYNIMYNGDTHFAETLEDMEKAYQDDYTRMVFMHPIEAKSDEKAPQPSGNFNRSIEKAQKAIQVRSIKKKPAKKSGKANDPKYKEWMKRDEYNPVLHNSWMLMARSQYYNGDFLNAASTFYYISKHFTWLPRTVTAAQIWRAQCYISLDWLYEAEMILTRIKPEELTSKELKALYYFAYADFLVHSKEYAKSVDYIKNALKYAKGAQKSRLHFLLGQVYTQLGEKRLAYEQFGKASSSSSATYRTKLNARIKQSEVFTGSDITPEVKSLKSMLKYDRNKEYLDQIYYAIGNLYLSRGDTTNAIENYELAAEKSTRNGIEKAVAQITLGGLYFDKRNYEKAQPCYSEAVPLLPETYANYQLLKRRSDVLDELAVYSQNVNLQDSLLRLADMPEEQRLKVIDKIIEDLKKKEKEEAEAARREEYLANQAANGNQLTDPNQREFVINSDNSWYFYNNASKTSGKTEFQKRWGSRKLEDDWRRRNKTVFNTSDFDSDSESGDQGDENTTAEGGDENTEMTEEERKAAEAANDPHNREFYLKQIPFTDDEKAISHEIIQEGLYNMGVILKDKLEDYPAALAEFNRLLNDYPDNIYRLDTYYNLYLMMMRDNHPELAERYRQLILSDFADSKYGRALVDPNYIENLRKMDQVQEQLYEQTYQAYLDNENPQVHALYAEMRRLYPMSPLMPKFMFLDALAYVTEHKPEQFNNVLREMLELYPTTDLAPTVSAWLKGLAQGRQLQTAEDGKNMRGMLWDIHLSNDSTFTANDSITFEINEDAPQLLVLVYSTDEIQPNVLLYEVARHNFNSFVVKDFDLEQMNFGRLGMLVVKGFANIRELNHYRRVMADSENFRLPAEVTPVPISEQNFQTLLNQGRTFDDYFRFMDQQNYQAPQSKLLPPDQVETLEEAEEAASLIEPVTPDDIDIDDTDDDDIDDDIDASVNPVDSIESIDNIDNIESVDQIVSTDDTPAATTAAPVTESTTPVPETPATPATETPATPATATPATPTPATPTTPAKPSTTPVSKPNTPTIDIPTGSEGDDDPLLD